MKLSFRIFQGYDFHLYRYRDGLLEIIVDDLSEGEIETDGAFRDDDVIMICSSEIYEYLTDDVIEYVLTYSDSPEDELCERAMENGAPREAVILLTRIGGGSICNFDVSPSDDDGRYDCYV